MTAVQTSPEARARRPRSARFRLDVGEWLVLRRALVRAAPWGAASPTAMAADFRPEAFGLAPEAPLPESERRRAWALLRERGLARYVPPDDDLDALVVPFAAALRALAEPEVLADVRSWAALAGTTGTIAWSAGRTVALSRELRRLTPARDGRERYEHAGAVELSLAADGTLLEEILLALPLRDDDGRPGPAVVIGWDAAHAVAEALRAGQGEIVPHLLDLPAESLATLGISARSLTGGAQLTVRCPGGGHRVAPAVGGSGHPDEPVLQGVWLWTPADVVELLDAAGSEVTLRRTSMRGVRAGLLSTFTGLLNVEEVL
ncbi:hypothetical protein [Georgenia faecalis]|uniref:hypothetical protein n=1 Tax=Georgenia faecalis TaxID=2483799 RepID=UPI000FD99FF3|nr:hypothetical protein [Georgenia faecalis]